MTDNEIIKALECCLDCNCKECPCCRIIDGGTYCTEIDEEEILDLINRQKAESEQWKEEANKYQNNWCESVKEIERLEKDRYIFKDGVLELIPRTDIEEIKSEAYKELAKRLKDRVVKKYEYTDIRVFNELDNLVKEMAGDNNG